MAFRRLLANVSRVRAHIPNGAHAHSRGLQRFVNTGPRHSVRSNRMNKMAFHTRLPKWINGRVKFTTHCEAPTFGHPAQFGLSGSNHSNVFNDFDVSHYIPSKCGNWFLTGLGVFTVLCASIAARKQKKKAALIAAASKGHIDEVKLLLQDSDVNKGEEIALLFASYNGNAELVSFLLMKEGVDVNQAGKDGYTPLFVASQKGHTEVVSLLLEKEGVDVNLAEKDGGTPLFIASLNGHTEVALLLLAKEGVDVNQAHKDGYTPLYIASQNGHTEVASLLLAKEGVNVNQAQKHGVTPLHVASRNGHTEVVSLLLAKEGIDVNLKDAFGATAQQFLLLSYSSGGDK